jgi:ACS family glucarate transporter-like MFS transporter
MEAWLPAGRWALAQGLHAFGMHPVGAALAPPILVVLIESMGWQPALILGRVPAAVAIGRRLDVVRAGYPQASERERGRTPGTRGDARGAARSARRQSSAESNGFSANRSIAAATLSYVCMNYVFYLLSSWSFLYLIQERHFALLEGGLLASLPPIGAAIGAATGGTLIDALSLRIGVKWGFRIVPLVALPLAGVFLLLSTFTDNPYVAVAALTLAYGTVEVNEAAYWAGTMRIAQADSMAATGVLNTGGNMGGWIGIPIVAYLSGDGHWTAAFVIGFFCAVVAAVGWLWVDTSRPLESGHAAA